MNNLQSNTDDLILLDDIYSEFADDIDSIPMILAEEDIEPTEIDSLEYINNLDYLKIKNTIYLKRNSQEIIISDKRKSSNLIQYEPTSNDTSYFLNIIYELNSAQEELIHKNNQLIEENNLLKNIIENNNK